MKSLWALLLSDTACTRANALYAYNRTHRRMPGMIARLHVFLTALAYLFLTLEQAPWRKLKARYSPWFNHLARRPYKPADPLRYLLQFVWLTLFPTPDPARGPGIFRRAAESIVHRLLQARTTLFSLLGHMPNRLRTSETLHSTRQQLGRLGKPARIVLMSMLTLTGTVLAALLITQPFSLLAQATFVALLWCMAMVVRRIPSHFSTLVLMMLSVTVSARYIWWRYTATINLDQPLDAFFGLTLLAAETYSWLVLILGYIQTALPLRRPPAELPDDTREWPVVDLMIPTYNEDLSVVAPTVYAALGMDWPRDKLRIHLLDDGRRESFRAFALETGINYIIRPNGKHAKAGNLNHALGKTEGDLVAIFDCDHIPTRSFLQLTVGWFLKDPKLALIQTPHHFFSPDPFERNLGHFQKQPSENTLFYGLVQDGNDLWNAAFFCGSCAVLRRSAIESIGGFAVETVTEDAHTALRLHRQGYTSAYLRIPQAAGLATESLSAHIGQRIRWARGMVQIFRMDNPLLGKGLSFFQRICYTNAMLHFMAGIPRIIYLTAPLAFLLFHSYIVYAPALAIVLNVLPHMAHALITNSHMQGSYRRTFWGEIYETVLAWYIARPTTVALFAPKKGTFNVTAKGGLVENQYFDWGISHPYVVLALLNVLGFGFGLWRLAYGPTDEVVTVLITMAWVIYNLLILGGAIAVAAEVKQVRKNHRVPSALPALLQTRDGHLLPATLSDFSEGGAGVQVDVPRIWTLDEPVHLILSRGEQRFSFPCRISRTVGSSLGVRFEALSRQQHIDLVQCTFARADSWLVSQTAPTPDIPMKSLRDIVSTSFRGYRQMARHLPFPLSIFLHAATFSLAWLVSLLPKRTPDAPHFDSLVHGRPT